MYTSGMKSIVIDHYFLWLGIWPTCDHKGNAYNHASNPNEYAKAGQLLANGFFGIVHLVKSDLDEFAKGLVV